MKTLFGLLMVGIISISAILTAAETKQVSYKISGMTCQGCVNKVNKVLDNTVGVEKYEINLKKGEAVIFYDPIITGEEAIKNEIGKTPFACETMTVEKQPAKKSFFTKLKALFN